MCHIGGVAGTLHLGTSGFAYPEWKGPFYPPDLRSKDMLGFYSSRFSSVEINYTFRRYPSEKTLATWRSQTPAGFLVTLKANQQITHWRRLADADEPVSRFLEAARPLGDRLGVILFQCPPNLEYDRSLIELFLAYLPPIARYAFEFRHPSWSEARELLASQRVAWCVAETDEHPVGADPLPAGPFVYLRLRKEGYSEEELAAWAGRIGSCLEEGREVFCYFKHEEKGAGPIFAERLGAMLGPGAGQP
jgi:uncharacterized protein YecE (DUF72 family)